MKVRSVEGLPKSRHLALRHHHVEELRDFATSEPLERFLGAAVDRGSNSV